MNTMYHMSQFMVVVSVPDEISYTLFSYLIQHILIKFGHYYLAVKDDGTPFKETFVAMC